MAQTKPLFVPWLYEQIQSERYPGVCWQNKERTTFSIPWKHASRQDSNNDDGLIFKAWAQTSTARDSMINPDSSVWKRNFRSALRAKGFRMILDNKNDPENPHKIYLFPTESNSAGSKRSQETNETKEWNLGDEELFNNLQSHDLDSSFHGLNLLDSSKQEESPLDWHEGFVDLAEELYQENSHCATPQFTEESSTEMVHSVQESYRTSAGGAIGGLEQEEMGQFSAAERTYEMAQYYPDGEHVGNQVANHCATCTLETFFQIKVYYKGKMMLDHLLENDAGFRLVYQGSMDSSAMESAVPVVNLPSPDNIHDQTQAMLTRQILENLGGLELRRSDGLVLGHRWGKSKVFWGVSRHEKSQTVRELSKNTPEVIYLFKDYVSGLMEFIKTNSGPSPSYTLYFFLGEKWPDPKMKPWEKKLIMIEVVLTSLEALNTMAVARGASSLESMELQVSLEQMMELC